MADVRQVLVNHLRECRQKCGLSQEKLAEIADISTQYLAIIETYCKFPTQEMLDHLTEALNIESREFF